VLHTASTPVRQEGEDSRAKTSNESQEKKRGIRLDRMASVLERLAWLVRTVQVSVNLLAAAVDDVVAGQLLLNSGLGAVHAADGMGEGLSCDVSVSLKVEMVRGHLRCHQRAGSAKRARQLQP